MIAYIGLGSNLGNSVATLRSALKSLHSHSLIIVEKVSGFYGSKPHGPGDQPDYVNAVAELETLLPPLQLLDELHRIEQDHHRIRTSQRWGPRTLDLDLLLYGNSVLESERLTIPHPRIMERPFVLIPLYEIAPGLIFPDGVSLADSIAGVAADELWKLED